MRLSIVIILYFIVTGCSDVGSERFVDKLKTINDIPDEKLEILLRKKIYFGHQSVGENIIDGILSLPTSKVGGLAIKESFNSESFKDHNFLHSSIGKNGDPLGKIADFKKKIDSGMGRKADIAFAKLCFWDIQKTSDLDKIFSEYKTTVDGLKKEYPDTIFMHITVPLMSHSNGIMARIKRLFRDDNGDLANIKRNELNNKILNEYQGKEPLFDIAKFESTLPSGERVYFVKDGKNYYYLPDEYTQDGGHLNEKGRKFVAEQMLIELADVASK